MSFTTGEANLDKALEELLAGWRTARLKWRDGMSDMYREKNLDPLAANVRSACKAMNDMAAILSKARRDCE